MFRPNRRRNFRVNLIILVLILTLFSFLASCGNTKYEYSSTSFAVHYLDVGEGDATLIKLPDGKIVLIDSGPSSKRAIKAVKEKISLYSNKIDYLILTHPDIEHVGGVVSLLEDFTVSVAYVPKITNSTNTPFYHKILSELSTRKVDIRYSKAFLEIVGQDYALAFLSPYERGDLSSYDRYNLIEFPSEEDKDDLSPIIYLEYQKIRFLFCSDAGVIEQESVFKNCTAQLYDNLFFASDGFSLEDIDFYKVSRHGDKDACLQEFIEYMKPKNAIISVGGFNMRGHPSEKVLLALEKANPNYSLYRTDRDKTISVYVYNGVYEIKTGD